MFLSWGSTFLRPFCQRPCLTAACRREPQTLPESKPHCQRDLFVGMMLVGLLYIHGPFGNRSEVTPRLPRQQPPPPGVENIVLAGDVCLGTWEHATAGTSLLAPGGHCRRESGVSWPGACHLNGWPPFSKVPFPWGKSSPCFFFFLPWVLASCLSYTLLAAVLCR